MRASFALYSSGAKCESQPQRPLVLDVLFLQGPEAVIEMQAASDEQAETQAEQQAEQEEQAIGGETHQQDDDDGDGDEDASPPLDSKAPGHVGSSIVNTHTAPFVPILSPGQASVIPQAQVSCRQKGQLVRVTGKGELRSSLYVN